jgi:hypothetical protein
MQLSSAYVRKLSKILLMTAGAMRGLTTRKDLRQAALCILPGFRGQAPVLFG